MIKIYTGRHVKYPLFLSDFKEIWIFSTSVQKNTEILSFIKIRPVEAEFFHVDWRTDWKTLRSSNSRFSQFCEST
jgi:hypothetical protein